VMGEAGFNIAEGSRVTTDMDDLVVQAGFGRFASSPTF